MSVSVMPEQRLFGLLELDSAGTVLYARTEADGHPSELLPEMRGRNFYTEIAAFANAFELKRHVDNFRESRAQATTLDFTCQYEDGPVTVRVLLARVREANGPDRTKSILVHMRPSR